METVFGKFFPDYLTKAMLCASTSLCKQEFCTKKYSGNLTLTEKKAVEFLEYRVHAREDKAIREGNSRQSAFTVK